MGEFLILRDKQLNKSDSTFAFSKVFSTTKQ